MNDEGQRSPTRQIGELPAANRKPTTLRPDDRLEHAMWIMRSKDFSQLPVMLGDSQVKGMITWKSIGERASVSDSGQFVYEYMDLCVKEIHIDAPLLDATEDVANGYVLVRGVDGIVTGIVTASDFAVQFRQLAEPFLVIEEIEYHLRRLIDGKVSVREMKKAVHKGYRKMFAGQMTSTWAHSSGYWSRQSIGTGSAWIPLMRASWNG